jgi:crotonobetainyl-CoA:carnitine CoA-transferase CaiB-like acyl-CoA transferase
VELFDRAELAEDPRYETNTDRSSRIDEVDEMVAEWVGDRQRDELVERLQAAGVPCAPVKELDEVAADPHLRERGMIEEIEHPSFGTIPVPGTPIRLSGSASPDVERAPTTGEDNQEVYRDRFGLSESEIEKLERDGVICIGTPAGTPDAHSNPYFLSSLAMPFRWISTVPPAIRHPRTHR